MGRFGGVRLVLGAVLVLGPCGFVGVAGAAGPGVEGSYRINPGDGLEVFVWGEDRMQREVRVLPDGKFSFPLAGTLVAQGRTSEELAAEIRQRIAGQYRSAAPEVTVSVKSTDGNRFYVVGKVRSPGSYSIGRDVNILQALSMAGGPADFADVDNAVLVSEGPGTQSVTRVRLSEALKGARSLKPGPQAQPLPVLRAGDVLVVP